MRTMYDDCDSIDVKPLRYQRIKSIHCRSVNWTLIGDFRMKWAFVKAESITWKAKGKAIWIPNEVVEHLMLSYLCVNQAIKCSKLDENVQNRTHVHVSWGCTKYTLYYRVKFTFIFYSKQVNAVNSRIESRFAYEAHCRQSVPRSFIIK